MANIMNEKPVLSAWLSVVAGIALVAMLLCPLGTNAQQPEEMVRPPRVRLLMRTALDHYKRGDYQGAATIFAQVQVNQNELSPTEQRDLRTFIQQNDTALAAQAVGTLQVREAEEALRLGKTQDAAGLVKGLHANQFLSPADKLSLAKLNQDLRVETAAKIGDKNDYKSLLIAAREAVKRGDLEGSEAYILQAEKVAPWLRFPGGESPSKLRHDIAAARTKQGPPLNVKENPSDKNLFTTVKSLFGGKREEKKDLPEGPPVARGPDQPMPTEPVVPSPKVEPAPAQPLVKNDVPQPQGPPTPKAPEGPNLHQAVYPGNDPSPSPGSGGANRVQARQLIKDGYKALAANDVDNARRLALQARDLHPDLEWWEENPGRLLEDIQRRTAARPVPPGANANNKAASPPTADARNLVKEARTLLQQEKIDAADKICIQAATAQPKGWGLFEDSPDKLRADIQKARTKRNREEAVRLMVEARKLYGLGNLQEAKLKAYNAQTLHGPYTIWDMSDRPQRLLEEIHRVEVKNNPAPVPPADVAKIGDPKKGPAPADAPAIPQNNKPGLVSGTLQAATKIRVVTLLQEARDLQKRGMLIEARAKAIEADQLQVPFGAEEDSPASVLVSLAAQCERTVDQLLQRATDQVQNHPTDPNRFKKAEADINAARIFARSFKLDDMRVDRKAQWLQQAAASSGLRPIAGVGTLNDPNTVNQAGGVPPTLLTPGQPGQDTPAGRNRLLGLERLDKARLELTAGNLPLARRLAEEAFNPQYGTQEEAAMVLRSIDADEHNHHVNVANRHADAGIEAYNRHDYRQAATIINQLDYRLLHADKAKRIGELMNTREMQPPGLQLVDAKQPSSGANPAAPVGTAFATDDDLTKNFRAMEDIQFQQMRDKSLLAKQTAAELFKAGKKSQAVEVLKDCLDEQNATHFDAQRLALLKRPVENRLQQYRTILAQESIEKQVDAGFRWDETKYQGGKRKTQEEVAEQIKLYRVLHKEGKYKEALAAARKAKELDPDNLAADAAIQITSINIAQKNYEKGKANNEAMVLDELNPDNGPHVSMTDPLHFDPDAMKRAQARDHGKNGYWSPTRDPLERAIERRLSEPVSLSFKDAPLRQVISDLHSISGVNIIADTRALEEANISLDQPLTLPVDKISLKSALNILLDQVKLTYVIKDQVLQITTKEKASGRMKMVTYSVADLVVPVENHPTPGIRDMNTALARHLASASGMVNNSASPYTNPLSLPGGATVSSQSSGAGSTFAMNANGVSPPSLVPTRAPGQTLEDLLINLIQNTIAQNSWNGVGGQGTIQYFPLGMALVVNQTQEVQEDVAALLASLRRLQDLEVAIEMRLVSVSESFFERIGVDFNVNIKTPTSRNEVNLVNGQFAPFGQVNRNLSNLNLVSGLTPAGTLTPDLNIPIKNSSFDFSVPPFGGYPGTLGADGGLSLGLAFLSDIQVFMFLEAAQGDRRMNVMQAPKLTVFNGQTANISVQDQQFFLTGVTLNQSNGQLFFSPNNQPFPLGVTMQVTPVVSADRRFVRLNLQPNLTNLTSTNVPLIPVQIPVPQLLEGPGNTNTAVGQPVIFQMFFQQPTFTTITVDTTVNVPDGGTVLLGGLKTMSEGRNEFGPPILSKIPYLSRLFKNVAYGRDGQSLMIMVTPRIIINEEEEQIFLGTLPPIPRP